MHKNTCVKRKNRVWYNYSDNKSEKSTFKIASDQIFSTEKKNGMFKNEREECLNRLRKIMKSYVLWNMGTGGIRRWIVFRENFWSIGSDGVRKWKKRRCLDGSDSLHILNQAQQSLDEVISGIAAGMPVDLVQIDMTNCWDKLGEITGDSAPDELITELFSQFCLGK